jgi:hypothetical protein
MADDDKRSDSEESKTASEESSFPINISDIDLSQVMGGLSVVRAEGGGTVMCCW